MTLNPVINIKMPAIIFLTMLACLSSWPSAFSQSVNQDSASAVRIVSKPSGVMVDLRGEHEFKGKTPFILPYQLSGRYRIQASRPGYETTSWVYTFVGQRPGLLNLKLQAMQPSKALYRSLILPGWGHHYSGRKSWGYLFYGLTAASAVAIGITENNYRNAQNQQRSALRQYNATVATGTSNDQRAALVKLNAATRTLNSSKRSRNGAIIALGVIWTLGAIDSIVRFPKQAPMIRMGGNIELSQREQPAELTLTMKLTLD